MVLRISAAISALAALVSCGPLNEGNVSRGFLAVVQSKIAGDAPAGPVAPPITRAQADANPGAFMLVTAYGGASVASLVLASPSGAASEDADSTIDSTSAMVASCSF